jgi:AraC-like DNA-binding protein
LRAAVRRAGPLDREIAALCAPERSGLEPTGGAIVPAVSGLRARVTAATYPFAATVFAINPAGPIDWGDLAGGAGYFDQAHFGHNFRAFTGLTPTRYVEVRRRFLREHPGHVLDSWPLPAG